MRKTDKAADAVMAEFAEQQAEMDQLFAEMGLPADMDAMPDEAAMMAAYHARLPDIRKASDIADPDARLAALRDAIARGVDLDATDDHGHGAFDQLFASRDAAGMVMMIDAGAETGHFDFAPAHVAVLRGDYDAAQDPGARDAQGRSPFLLACRMGQAALVARFLADDPAACRADRCNDGEDAIMVAIRGGEAATIRLLLAEGFDPDRPDAYGGTPLFTAVEQDDVTAAQLLLDQGARLDVAYNTSAYLRDHRGTGLLAKLGALTDKWKPADVGDCIQTIYDTAHSADMVRLLVARGADASRFDREVFATAIGADALPPRHVTAAQFRAQYAPRPGSANPERVDVPFWHEQIRTNRGGWAARSAYEVESSDCDGPVWSFDRFGRTGTLLPDGRLVLIAGEHEDAYDPDFCIYNDVTVMHPGGGMDHYIYPFDIFPPTDFHTATLDGDQIWIIGSLGYQGYRPEGVTQVMRLDLADFSIHPVKTTGDNPGWINRHSACHTGRDVIISGGKVEPGYRDLQGRFVLNLDTRVWTRAA